MSEEQQWYTNKELFEQINKVNYEFKEIRTELRETRDIIKKYNGLREQIGEVKDRVEDMEARQDGMKKVYENIRNWGGWLFGLITLAILVYNTFLK